MADDPVHHPTHYTRGRIEVFDFIQDQGLNFALGNAVKYICRAGFKEGEDPVEALKKAQWYLTREIQQREELRMACQRPESR